MIERVRTGLSHVVLYGSRFTTLPTASEPHFPRSHGVNSGFGFKALAVGALLMTLPGEASFAQADSPDAGPTPKNRLPNGRRTCKRLIAYWNCSRMIKHATVL